MDRRNKIFERFGMSDRLKLPDRKFNRHIGQFTGARFDPDGRMLTEDKWTRRRHPWLPSPADKQYLLSIMNTPSTADPRDQGTAGRLRVHQNGDLARAQSKGRGAKGECGAKDGGNRDNG